MMFIENGVVHGILFRAFLNWNCVNTYKIKMVSASKCNKFKLVQLPKINHGLYLNEDNYQDTWYNIWPWKICLLKSLTRALSDYTTTKGNICSLLVQEYFSKRVNFWFSGSTIPLDSRIDRRRNKGWTCIWTMCLASTLTMQHRTCTCKLLLP